MAEVKRVMQKFYHSKDYQTDSWCVLEHINAIVGHLIETNLTEEEAIKLAEEKNENIFSKLLP